jgi:hypothetical protein
VRKPYFREFDGWWYAQVRVGTKRKQVKLVKGRDQERRAYELFNELKAKEPDEIVEASNLTVFEAVKLFRDWSHKAQKPATSELARHFLQGFVDHLYLKKPCGKLRLSALKPLHVTDWLVDKKWNPTTRNRAISILKRALNWCVEQGVITKNPLRDMKKPRERRRETLISPEQKAAILAAVPDQAFLDFLFALGQTGARPAEIRTVTAADLKDGYWELDGKTTDVTGDKRCVYLTPKMTELCQKLAVEYPEGPLFRNTRGQGNCAMMGNLGG